MRIILRLVASIATCIGLILALTVAIPIWSYASAKLGYELIFSSLVIEAFALASWIVSRSGLALGLASMIVTLFVLMSLLLTCVSPQIDRAAITELLFRVKYIEARFREPITIYGWKITVLKVSEPQSVVIDDELCRAEKGFKMVVVKIRITNELPIGRPLVTFFELETDNGTYLAVGKKELKCLNITNNEAPSSAMKVNEFGFIQGVDPNSSIEGYAIFEVPTNAKLKEVLIHVGLGGGYVAKVALTRNSIVSLREHSQYS